jgi:hypothetical protein
MASSLQQMAATITERSRTLINNDLKKICKEEGTAQTGNKAALQARVVGRMCLPCAPVHDTAHFMFWPPIANFTLTSHNERRLQERRRGAAAAAVPRPAPRRRTHGRSQQQPRRAFLHSTTCPGRQRLRRRERIPEQRIVSALPAAPNAVAYARLAPQPSPGLQLSVTRTPVLLQG